MLVWRDFCLFLFSLTSYWCIMRYLIVIIFLVVSIPHPITENHFIVLNLFDGNPQLEILALTNLKITMSSKNDRTGWIKFKMTTIASLIPKKKYRSDKLLVLHSSFVIDYHLRCLWFGALFRKVTNVCWCTVHDLDSLMTPKYFLLQFTRYL